MAAEPFDNWMNWRPSANPNTGRETGEIGGNPVFLSEPEYYVNKNVIQLRVNGILPLTIFAFKNGNKIAEDYIDKQGESRRELSGVPGVGVYTFQLFDNHGREAVSRVKVVQQWSY